MNAPIRISDLKHYLRSSQVVRAAVRRERIAEDGSYVEFVQCLYEDIDASIYEMQAGLEVRQSDSEDRLTADILLHLRRLGYRATHDGKTGGHVDMSVRLGAYSWIGEAKKNGNFNGGLAQIRTRYKPASGNYAHFHVGLILYLFKSKDALATLKKFQRDMRPVSKPPCLQCANNPLAFYSQHKFAGSGTRVIVRTMGVSLYHRPEDRAGLAKRQRQAKPRTS